MRGGIMATIIGDISQIRNKGERTFFSALEAYLSDSYVVYWNRELYGREFDVCILIPDIGICVVEVKGWHEDTVIDVPQGETILIRTRYGQETHNPRKQARAYRYSVADHIRSRLGKQPRVFHMVCYPFISKEVFFKKQMDLVSEQEITFLADDLVDKESFRKKLDLAIDLNRFSGRDPFGSLLMHEVRGLFEPAGFSYTEAAEYDLGDEDVLYSIVAYVTKADPKWEEIIERLTYHYAKGSKVTLVAGSRDVYEHAKKELIAKLASINVRPNERGDLEIGRIGHYHPSTIDNCFNWRMFVYDAQGTEMADFHVINGQISNEAVLGYLRKCNEAGMINLEQFWVEHSPVDKNIIVTAGAGTGKTHVMISRIAYLCYREKINPAEINDLITMLTFTNDAAENMRRRLKKHFKNSYLLTGDRYFLRLVVQVDRMSISTIDSYAKSLIDQLGMVKGYGSNCTVSSGTYERKRLIADTLENYLEKRLADDDEFLAEFDLPIWELRDLILDFVVQLENKNVGISMLTPDNFGDNDGAPVLHEIITEVLIAHDKIYQRNLREENKCNLGSLISLVRDLVSTSWGRLKFGDLMGRRFLFVDEFQDTDNSQIELLKEVKEKGNYCMFVVGDIKQCIYRFRGAEVDAFGQLDVNKDDWLSFSLTKNYRTAPELLEDYHRVFLAMAGHRKRLLVYENKDKLLPGGTKGTGENRCLRPLTIETEDQLGEVLFQEVRDLRDELLSSRRFPELSNEERTIALLVRENWQAARITRLAAQQGFFDLETVAGRGLFQSDPALDLFILLRALEGVRVEALLELAQSHYFRIPVPRWRIKELGDKESQVRLIKNAMDEILQFTCKKTEGYCSWDVILEATKTTPILQVLQILQGQLKPWENYSSTELGKRFYQINSSFLFEEIVRRIGLDSLTIIRLLKFMKINLISKARTTECRIPPQSCQDVRILCTTVHKAKGLEYGNVILPFTNLSMYRGYKKGLRITVDESDRIGYFYSSRRRSYQVQNNLFAFVEESDEQMKEEARILYVAMTRAMNSLSWVITSAPPKNSWQTLLEEVLVDAV